MISARTVNLIILTAILVFAGANASAQPTPIAFNSIPHPASKLNTLIGYGSKLIAGNVDGIFVSADNGQTWVAQNDGLPSPIQIYQLVSLNNLIFAATDKGIWKSDNEAQGWSDVGAGVLTNQAVSALYVLGENIFVGTSSPTPPPGTPGDRSGKLMRSSDFGQSWKQVNAGLPVFNFVSSISSIGNTILLVIDNYPYALFKSSDNGNSWRRGGEPGNNAKLKTIATSGPIIFAIGSHTPGARPYAARWSSSDLGDSWKFIEERGGPSYLPVFWSLVVSGSSLFYCYQQSPFSPGSNPYSSFEGVLYAEKTSIADYKGRYDRVFLVNEKIYLTKAEIYLDTLFDLLQSNKKVLTPAATIVSAASYQLTSLASESIGSVFGTGMALTTAAAAGMPSTSLENVSVFVRDSAGTEKPSPLFYVSPTQINFQLPAGLAGGMGIVTVKLYNQIVASGLILIANTSPGLFSVNQTGEGFAAATVQRVAANGDVSFQPIAQYDSSVQKFIPIPINVQSGTDQAYLNLYGTGIRGRSEIANVKATVDGIDVPVSYSGSQGTFLGVDQVNVLLPSSLAGKKEVSVFLTVDNEVANPVKIFIQ